MVRTTQVLTLQVLMNGYTVGYLSKAPNGAMSFQYDQEWLLTKGLGLEIAKAFGLPTGQAQIEVFDGVKVLVLERFDRRWSSDQSWLMRLPQEES